MNVNSNSVENVLFMEKEHHIYLDPFKVLWTNPKTNVAVINIPDLVGLNTRTSSNIMEFHV